MILSFYLLKELIGEGGIPPPYGMVITSSLDTARLYLRV